MWPLAQRAAVRLKLNLKQSASQKARKVEALAAGVNQKMAAHNTSTLAVRLKNLAARLRSLGEKVVEVSLTQRQQPESLVRQKNLRA